MRSKTFDVTKKDDWIKPTQYYVIVKPDDVDAMTNGGLVIPDTVMGKEQVAREKGVIISVGPTAFPEATWGDDIPKIGDRVMFARFAGTLFKDPKTRKDYRIFEDHNVCAICVEEKE